MHQQPGCGAPHQWLLKRNCSLSPVQLAGCFSVLGFISMLIAVIFAANGAWPVVLFSFIELLGLLLAYVVYGRHAADYERIVVDESGVVVESVSADRMLSVRLRPAWLKVEYEDQRRDLIRLVQGGQSLFVGRFVAQEQRKQLADELRLSLLLLNRVGKVDLKN